MINSLIMTIALLGQCSGGNCGVSSGYTNPYMGGYIAPPAYVVVEPTTYMHIQNVPGGHEQYRTYVNVKLEDGTKVKLPAINGYVPTVGFQRLSNGGYRYILDYSEGHVLVKQVVAADGYIHYFSNQAKTASGPKAVKDLDSIEHAKRKTKGPKAVRVGDDVPATVEKSDLPKVGVGLPTDAEIEADLQRGRDVESLLKKPSSVPFAPKGIIPNY